MSQTDECDFMKKLQVNKLVKQQTTKIQGKVDKINVIKSSALQIVYEYENSLIICFKLNKDIIKNNILQVENITTEMINDYQRQLYRQKTSIISEFKTSEKILLEITNQNPKLLKSESLNIKFETKKPEPINVELSALIGLSQFRKGLGDQLADKVENVSRDVRIFLQYKLLKYKHNIAKEEGKFSDRDLRRKILEGINKVAVAENLSQQEMDKRFHYFWHSEYVLDNLELKTLQANIQSMNLEQHANYGKYVKDGVQIALGSFNYEISVRTQFPDMDSIYQWNFNAQRLQSIKVMEDPEYFEDRRYRQYGQSRSRLGSRMKIQSTNYITHHNQVNNSYTGFINTIKTGFSTKNFVNGESVTQSGASRYATFMTELYSIFDKSIDDHPQTKRHFDGSVEAFVIRNLCMKFKGSLEELAAKYKITNYLKPHFIVTCVVFASFKMLLPRLTQNSDQSLKKRDPVKQLEMRKDYYKKLFILKLNGAEKKQIWSHQIVHRLKEAIVQMYMQIDESQATHNEVYELIKEFSTTQENSFPSIETYRKFQFCMYKEIMDDAQSGQDKSLVFRKWKKFCNYDLEHCEKDFIRSGFSFDLITERNTESIVFFDWSIFITLKINSGTYDKKFAASAI